jgi:hypothetical protein
MRFVYPFAFGSSAFFCCPGGGDDVGVGGVAGVAGLVVSVPLRRIWPSAVAVG